MATYVVLTSFTDQGIRNIKDTIKRSDAVKDAAGKFGVKVRELFWTMGSYDLVGIFEAPDDESFTAFGLAIGAGGNIRTQSLRAFSREEMGKILAKLG
ncbi:MAG: GYD domain-containing protein [Burkholderiales bacterium]|nr:GYD domain-containing protein [Burkholderiales bacterium]